MILNKYRYFLRLTIINELLYEKNIIILAPKYSKDNKFSIKGDSYNRVIVQLVRTRAYYVRDLRFNSSNSIFYFYTLITFNT
jgi:hypothetical protein